MTFKTTVMYQFKDEEEAKKFWDSHISPLYVLNSKESLPVEIKAVSLSDLFEVVEDIENLINDEDVDSYELVEGIQNIIDNQYGDVDNTYSVADTEKVFDEMVLDNQKEGLYNIPSMSTIKVRRTEGTQILDNLTHSSEVMKQSPEDSFNMEEFKRLINKVNEQYGK